MNLYIVYALNLLLLNYFVVVVPPYNYLHSSIWKPILKDLFGHFDIKIFKIV